MRENYGVDMLGHRSRLLSDSDAAEADVIIPVKRDLGQYIAQSRPSAQNKLLFFQNDVQDPWRQPVSVFRNCAQQISSEIDLILPSIRELNI